MIADETADAEACAADLLAQAEHGPDSEALLLSTDPRAVRRASLRLVARYDNITVETVASLAEALARSEAFAPEHLELHVARSRRRCSAGVRNAGSVFVGGSAVIGDYAAGATHVLPTGGLARSSGGLGLEMFMKPLQIVRATRRRRRRRGGRDRPDRARRGAAAPRSRRRAPAGAASRMSEPATVRDARRPSKPTTQPAGGGRSRSRFRTASRPYAWAATVAEVAARHGLAPAQVLKFDQNTPAAARRRADPARRELRDAERVPRRARTASSARRRRRTSRARRDDVGWEQIVVGAGADDLILLCARTFLGAGPHGVDRPADLRALPHRDAARRRRSVAGRAADGASLIWRCNPDNPTGVVTPAAELVELARASSRGRGRRRRGLRRVRRRDRSSPGSTSAPT